MERIKVNPSDLENIGKNGFVEGISNVFLRELKQLEYNERPVHCSDIKREHFQIRVGDQWIQENEDRTNLKKVINNIAHKNIQAIIQWQQANPSFMDITSKKHEDYMTIVFEAMGGETAEEKEHFNRKIIHKIANHVTIDKSQNNP
jgi:hypothetical protein